MTTLLAPYPSRRHKSPGRATYCVVGACLGVCATLAVCQASNATGRTRGLDEATVKAFTSRWFVPIRASGGELHLKATPAWVRAAPEVQEQAATEAYDAWRQARAEHWYCRLFVQDASGIAIVALAGTPRGMTTEPPDFFKTG